MENKVINDNLKTSNMISMEEMEAMDMNRFNLYNKAKRFIDILLSLAGIILLSPIFVITAVLIKLESTGPIIFKQTRAGKNSEPFHIYKFRSMRVDAPNIATNDFVDSASYITKIGRVIRRTSIDELPQLFNILKGDMSIVGPRPVILEESELIELRKVYKIDTVLPGITGWAQINGRDSIDNDEKVMYDHEYLMKRSLKLDLYIVVNTALKVLKRSDIKE